MIDAADICDQKQDAYAAMSEGPEDEWDGIPTFFRPLCADCQRPATRQPCGLYLCISCLTVYGCNTCDGDDPECIFAKRFDKPAPAPTEPRLLEFDGNYEHWRNAG